MVNGARRGRIEREYALGRGRTDLLIVWPQGDRERRFVVECKVLCKGLEWTIAEGVEQTRRYVDRCGEEAGHLIVFDRTPDRPWSEEISRHPPAGAGAPVTVCGCSTKLRTSGHPWRHSVAESRRFFLNESVRSLRDMEDDENRYPGIARRPAFGLARSPLPGTLKIPLIEIGNSLFTDDREHYVRRTVLYACQAPILVASRCGALTGAIGRDRTGFAPCPSCRGGFRGARRRRGGAGPAGRGRRRRTC